MPHIDVLSVIPNDNTTLPKIGFGTYRLNGSTGASGNRERHSQRLSPA
ncbi:hypothetical protein [Microvirga flavescens]|nr:hypothetical protein [Microvirga flavescens]